MNCQFCQHPLQFSHRENNQEVVVYDCINCPILTSFFHLDEDSPPIKIIHMIDRNDRLYLWTNNFINNTSYITDLTVTLSSLVYKNPVVVKFPHIMDITPTNVLQKFSFIMTYL